MKKAKIVYPVALGLILGLAWMCNSMKAGMAEPTPEYVGSDVCAMCHSDVVKKWSFATHRRTLLDKDPAKRGCEACHGPGGAHVAGGGDKTKIIRPQLLKPEDAAHICLKCHTQEKVTLWPTSQHARSKLTCTKCHDPHSVGEKSLLSEMDSKRLLMEGLTKSIKDAELAVNALPADSPEKDAQTKKLDELKAERVKLEKSLKSEETVYHQSAEPYVCYNCHKAQEVQSHLPSHHPLEEGKMKCSDCHNPHGGTNGMLKEETVTETCRTCHAEKAGPFVFEHVPVTEDCTNCHKPHGSVQDNLLTQPQAFLCQKCHANTHAPRGSATRFAERYTTCTKCHTMIHGSDTDKVFFN